MTEHQQSEINQDLAELREQWPLQEAKLAATSNMTSKMWILPDGKLQPLNQWHWAWLKANPGVANRFKIGEQVNAIEVSDEQNGRKVALRAGFYRVNYERNSGRLTIEGCKKNWRSAIKDAVFMLVMENSEKIDSITLNLFGDDVANVVSRGSAVIRDYDDMDKVNHIPLLSESPRGKALRIVSEERRKAL